MSTSSGKKVKVVQGAVVCVESIIQGSVTIGTKTVIHPRASIIAENGAIEIGETNIFEEQCLVKHSYDANAKDRPEVLKIGCNNVFEVGCTVLAKVVGDDNVFEAKCFVGPDIEVGNGCVVGSGVHLKGKEKLQDNIIITGKECARTISTSGPEPQTLQIDFLSKVLPNYHHLKKPNAQSNSAPA